MKIPDRRTKYNCTGGERSAPGLRLFIRLLSRPRFRPSRDVRVCRWVWMFVRFVCVIRVPVCARVSRVCPVCVPAPTRSLFTEGSAPQDDAITGTIEF